MRSRILAPLLALSVLASGCGEKAEPEPEQFFGVWKRQATGENERELTIELKPPNQFIWTDYMPPVLSGTFNTNGTNINFIMQEPKDFVKREAKMAGVEVWQLPHGYRFEGEALVIVPLNGAPEMRMEKQ